MKLSQLDEKMDTAIMTKLSKYVADQIKREAQKQLNHQEFSKNALKTRMAALASEFSKALESKISK